MNITKETLSEIDYIDIALENCDSYSIKPENIVDILFDEFELDTGREKYSRSRNGRLVLSKNMFHQLSRDAFIEFADGTTALDHDPEEDYYFYNRITSWCDIVSIDIHYKNGKIFEFFVEYNPIINDLCGSDVEYSNCPSAEIDENGDMLILFGKSSHSPKRIDNDYFNVIEGLNELLPQKNIDTLWVVIETIGNDGVNCWSPDGGLYVEMRIKNKEYKNKCLPLEFFDVDKMAFCVDLKNMCEEDFNISPTADGRFFVQFGEICNFYCKRIKVFEGF